MKTIFATLALVAATFAALPAAADCSYTPETGTSTCTTFADSQNYGIGVNQNGVGGAAVDSYEFSFFGQTYAGKNVLVYTAYDSPVGSHVVAFSEFCMKRGDECAFQDDTLFVYVDGVGYQTVGVSQSGDGRSYCTGGNLANECGTLP